MTDNDPNQGPPSLDPAQAEALLDRLANDEAFRQLFCSDGPAALAAIGYHGPTESKACFKVEKLASPQELIAAACSSSKSHEQHDDIPAKQCARLPGIRRER